MRSFRASASRHPILLLMMGMLAGGVAVPAAAQLTFPETARQSVAPAAGQPRLHGVVTYFGGRVPVFVAPREGPQVLHLSSNHPAIWHVYLLPGANVTAIYVAGLDPQQVVLHRAAGDRRGPAPRIRNLGRRFHLHPELSNGAPFQLGAEGEAAYRAELRATTGLDLTDFQGHAQVRPGEAFLLGTAPDPARLRALFPDAFQRDARPATADFAAIREDLALLIRRGHLPSALPLWSDHMALDEDAVPTWPVLPQMPAILARPDRPAACGEVQLGTAGDDHLNCDWGVNRRPYSVAQTRWLVAGDGHDLIVDFGAKSQVLSGGRGNDLIYTDLGNDVIHFGRNWGDDILSLRCNVQRPEDEEFMPYNPRYRTSRYVVFGRGIRPADLVWTGPNQLVHRPSGSRILFYDWPCVTFLAVEPGRIPPPPHLAALRAAEQRAEERGPPVIVYPPSPGMPPRRD